MVGVRCISEKTQKASTVSLPSVCYCESGKARLLERCSLFKVRLHAHESVRVRIFPCVLVIRAITEPHTVPLVARFPVILVNRAASVQNVFPLLGRIGGPISAFTSRAAQRSIKGI